MSDVLGSIPSRSSSEPPAWSLVNWSAGVTLGIAMCLPTLIFLLQMSPYVQAASILFYIIPLTLLMPNYVRDVAAFQRIIVIIVSIAFPLLFSIGLHIQSYDMLSLQTALIPIIATMVYIFTICVVLQNSQPSYVLSRSMQTMALVLLATFLFVSLTNPSWHWGRFDPGDVTSPQWWAELLIGVIFGASFFRLRVLRYGLWFLGLASLVLVQSRNGIATSLVLIGFATLQYEGIRRLTLFGALVLLVGVPTMILVDVVFSRQSFFAAFFQWLNDNVLFLNHPTRGLGSGMTGRDDTWRVALDLIAQYPFAGVGFDRADVYSKAITNLQIHNGHLSLMADLGLILYFIIFVVMVGAVVRCFMRRDYIAIAYILPFTLLAMMFKPRAINMSVLPMLFWMLIGASWFLPTAVGAGLLSLTSRAPRPNGTPDAPGVARRWQEAKAASFRS